MTFAYDRSGRGPAVLLLHGNGHSRHEYGAVLRALATRADVIAWDMPGHGESPALADPSIDALAGAAIALLDSLGVSRATVVGSSVGASIALSMAARHPERVDGLVLVEPQCRSREWWDASWPLVDKVFGRVTQPREAVQARFVSPVTDEMYAQWNADRALAGVDAMVGVMEAMREFDWVGAAARIAAPAIAVYGADGPAITGCDELCACLAGLQVDVVEKCGHFVAIERPDTVVAAVDAVCAMVSP